MRPVLTVEQMMRRTANRVFETLFNEGARITIVDSPPGAGKTDLVEKTVALAAQRLGLSVAVVTPTVEQSFDLVRRLVANFDGLPIEILLSENRQLPADLAADPRVPTPISMPRALRRGRTIVIGTVDKFFFGSDDAGLQVFDLMVCDEAYQVAYRKFAPLLKLAEQFLFVGDPGQLPPLSRVELARFEGAPSKVHWAVPKELLRLHPEIPVVQLPASRRLPQDTVNFLQPSFYPTLPFQSSAPVQQRRLSVRNRGFGGLIDVAVDHLCRGETVVSLILPPSPTLTPDFDEEVAETMADVVRRIIDRGMTMGAGLRLTGDNIGCVDAHVASGANVTKALRARALGSEIMVGTPEIWQGLQRPVMVVKHPLSGLKKLDRFALDPGRCCVMLSRHQAGCIVVTRDGVEQILDAHQHDCESTPMAAVDAEWNGWRAHRALWDGLRRGGRLLSAN